MEKSVVIPVVHLPELYGASARVAFWNRPGVTATGAWSFADLWLEPDRP
jgi:hypothetical protein